jgi:hypothetical protein
MSACIAKAKLLAPPLASFVSTGDVDRAKAAKRAEKHKGKPKKDGSGIGAGSVQQKNEE